MKDLQTIIKEVKITLKGAISNTYVSDSNYWEVYETFIGTDIMEGYFHIYFKQLKGKPMEIELASTTENKGYFKGLIKQIEPKATII